MRQAAPTTRRAVRGGVHGDSDAAILAEPLPMDCDRPPALSGPAWQPLGPHRFAIENDTLLWSPQGEISEREGDLISDQMVELARVNLYMMILIEGRNSPPLRYEVRRIYADKIKRHRIRLAVAVYGGKAASRAIATLTFRAARLISGLDIEMRYTSTEGEARQFLGEQRVRLRQTL